MREIKFRAWDKTMSYFTLQELCSDMGYVNCKNVMQYTGLKDKNGKEIYEGDILGWKKNPKYSMDYNKLPVIFKDGQFCFYSKNNVWGYIVELVSLSNFLEDKKPCMVIGNIYENPELLK